MYLSSFRSFLPSVILLLMVQQHLVLCISCKFCFFYFLLYLAVSTLCHDSLEDNIHALFIFVLTFCLLPPPSVEISGARYLMDDCFSFLFPLPILLCPVISPTPLYLPKGRFDHF